MKSKEINWISGGTIVKTIDENDTITVTSYFNGFKAVGRAKLNPTDFFDETLGESIAIGRMWQKLGRQIERYAESRSETIEQHRGRMKIERRQREMLEDILHIQENQRRAAFEEKKAERREAFEKERKSRGLVESTKNSAPQLSKK